MIGSVKVSAFVLSLMMVASTMGAPVPIEAVTGALTGVTGGTPGTDAATGLTGGAPGADAATGLTGGAPGTDAATGLTGGAPGADTATGLTGTAPGTDAATGLTGGAPGADTATGLAGAARRDTGAYDKYGSAGPKDTEGSHDIDIDEILAILAEEEEKKKEEWKREVPDILSVLGEHDHEDKGHEEGKGHDEDNSGSYGEYPKGDYNKQYTRSNKYTEPDVDVKSVLDTEDKPYEAPKVETEHKPYEAPNPYEEAPKSDY